jgi:hypothetical protein
MRNAEKEFQKSAVPNDNLLEVSHRKIIGKRDLVLNYRTGSKSPDSHF